MYFERSNQLKKHIGNITTTCSLSLSFAFSFIFDVLFCCFVIFYIFCRFPFSRILQRNFQGRNINSEKTRVPDVIKLNL